MDVVKIGKILVMLVDDVTIDDDDVVMEVKG